MRLRSLVPALAFLALAACDSTGALKIAQAPAAKPNDCCCKPAAASCPPAAAPTPIAAQPTAMAPEPERVAHRPAAHHRAARPTVRRVAVVQRDQVEGEFGEVRESAYAQQRSYAAPLAPAHDGYVDMPDRRLEGRGVSLEARETSSERYSERSEGYGSGSRRYAGGYEERGRYGRGDGGGCGGCASREAAGRDHNGFLTWPGKVPARP